MSEQQNNFTGWAVVEIMGHQKVYGYVETCAFGSVVMFKVSYPGQEPVEQLLDKDRYIGSEWVYAGAKIRVSRDAYETYVGAGSVYRMTPLPEEAVLSFAAQRIEVLERVERKRLASSVDDVAPEDEMDFEPEEDADA